MSGEDTIPNGIGRPEDRGGLQDPYPSKTFNYSTVVGYFFQDDPLTDPDGYDFTTANLGLIDRSYPVEGRTQHPAATQWQRFAAHVAVLNADAAVHGPDVPYRVLFLARHGHGFHNQAESQYGTLAWDAYWSTLEGNGVFSWADSLLNPEGEAQTRSTCEFWRDGLRRGIPAPQRYFVSPLRRCLQTARMTFDPLADELPEGRPFAPTIKEDLREAITIHTCDRRSSKSAIARMVPGWEFELGFKEDDPYWSASIGENDGARLVRARKVLDDIMAETDATWISITSHSVLIRWMLRVLGHRPFELGTGQVIPVLVRVERK